EQGLANVDLVFEGLNLSRVGGVEHMQFGPAADLAKRHLQNFRAKAGSTHAEQKHMGESGSLHVFRKFLEVLDASRLIWDNTQPAQPVGFIRIAPQRRITLP